MTNLDLIEMALKKNQKIKNITTQNNITKVFLTFYICKFAIILLLTKSFRKNELIL